MFTIAKYRLTVKISTASCYYDQRCLLVGRPPTAARSHPGRLCAAPRAPRSAGPMPNKTIKVCVRTRPTATFAAEQIVIDGDKNSIVINKKQTAEEAASTLNNAQTNFKFQFHHVLHNASQDTVYETLARDVVQDVVDGINGTII